MNDIIFKPMRSQPDVEDEVFAPNPDLTAEEIAEDRFVHLLLTAWTMFSKGEQETD